MRALVLTNEYRPNVYGGAGVDVAELTRHLRQIIGRGVRTFGSHAEQGQTCRVGGYAAGRDAEAADGRLESPTAQRAP